MEDMPGPRRNEEQEKYQTSCSLPDAQHWLLWIQRAPPRLGWWFFCFSIGDVIWVMFKGEACCIDKLCLKLTMLLISSSLGKSHLRFCSSFQSWLQHGGDDDPSVAASSQELLVFNFFSFISHLTVWKQLTEIKDTIKDNHSNIKYGIRN